MKSFSSKKEIRLILSSLLRAYSKKGCKIEILDFLPSSYLVNLYMPCVSSIFIERIEDKFNSVVSVFPSKLSADSICLRFDAYKFK